jgi:hypothetical protein
MRYRSCDFFGSPEEVQVDRHRHASRLVEGEGEPTLSPSCLPPRPNQPRRFLHQNPSRLPPPGRPSLPSRHPLSSSTPTHLRPPQPYRNTPTTRPIQSLGCSTRQGLTYPFLTLAFTRGLHFKNCPHPSLALHLTIHHLFFTLHFKQGIQRIRPPQPHQRPGVHHLLSCLASAFVICLTSFLH